MTYRIMLLVELTKLSDMSDNFVVIMSYSSLSLGKSSLKGRITLPKTISPSPGAELLIWPVP